ncbi:GNAT family N-acetyltransferase [Roseisolibacter sp. H3M3-2]|uniref:GNAT family N-acetyltransferase n=1 Tax=Roseisolibacter sp. H3M3-2 TaxID=3031323 RepID=UPI0023DBD60C|nr:GNAT family N-acetyltransferase [Roseisolibacter sp. H3M3-2]MDF1506015.1 GNAT family N-acetyltransferase [Roseisolibacter sp. H3M3-2]
MTGPVEIRSAADDPASLEAARALVREHVLAHSTAHGPDAAERLAAALPAPFAPRGGLWVAWAGGEALGCVALQPLADGAAELKRMFVLAAARGREAARALQAHAIAEALARGHAVLRLGTLTTMHAAQRLYEGAGFRRVPAYRPTEFGDTWFYERAL